MELQNSDYDILCQRFGMLVGVMGPDYSLQRLNPLWGELLGFAETELLGQSLRALIHPYDLDAFDRDLLDEEAGSRPLNFRLVSKNQAELWFQWQIARHDSLFYLAAHPLHHAPEPARPSDLHTGGRSQAHKLEERCKKAEADLQNLISASPYHIVRIDHNFHILAVNYVDKVFEDTPLLGRCVLEFIPESHHAFVRDKLNRALAHETVQPFELQAAVPNGEPQWYYLRVVPLQLQGSHGPELMLVSQNITQQHHADEWIRTLASLIEASHDIIGFADPQLRPVYFNESTKKQFGWSLDVPTIAAYVPRHTLKKYYEEVKPYITETDKQWEGEVEILNWLNGELVPVWQRTFCLKDVRTNQVLYYATVATDLRHKKADEVRLIQASKMATLGEMAGGIAHEINNPLAVIQGAVRKIRRELQKNAVDLPAVSEAINSTEATTMRIAHIIKGLRAYARDDSQEPMVSVKVVDIVQDVLGFSAQRMQHHGVKLLVGEFPSQLQMDCRPVQITQILLNLLSNSFDAVQDLEEQWIQLNTKADSGFIEFELVDSGRGIPKEIADKMMNPFFTSKPVGKGTGLGLSIAKGLAQVHGGCLRYDPQSQHTRFVLRLPQTQLADVLPGA